MRTSVFSWMMALLLLVATACGAVGLGWGNRGGGVPPQKDGYRLEGPFTQGNLSVFLVHGKDKIKGQTFITLQEALVQRKVIVRETREVNSLTIENISGEEVYVQSGDIVKGGAQDRMLVTDLILPPDQARSPSTLSALKTAAGAVAELKRSRNSLLQRIRWPAVK